MEMEVTDTDATFGHFYAKMTDVMGPQAVDQLVRQAITTCWMLLPEGKKTVADVEREIRRLVDRALANLREDARAFGVTEATSPAGPTGQA